MVEFVQGSLEQTGTSSDAALDGDGFFVVGPERGADERSRKSNRQLYSIQYLLYASFYPECFDFVLEYI